MISQTLFYTVLNLCDLFTFFQLNHTVRVHWKKKQLKERGKEVFFCELAYHYTELLLPTDADALKAKRIQNAQAESHANNY